MSSHTSFNNVIDSFVKPEPIRKTIIIKCNHEGWFANVLGDSKDFYSANSSAEAIGRCILNYTKNFGPIIWNFDE